MRMTLHVTLSSQDVVVVVADTDVLILIIHAYSKYMSKQRWFLRYENNKCADIETIFSYFGKWYALVLLIYSFIMT